MFFNLGLTADFAAAHRHEFSAPRANPPQSSLSPLSSITFPPQPSSDQAGRRPTAPVAPLSAAETVDGVMFAGSDRDTCSDSGLSRSNSITSSGLPAAESRKLANRARASYQLAHPPPAIVHRQRLHIRPRLLLQLQKLSSSTRPTPTFDVLPSTIFAPRLARKLPRFFTGKDGLGPDDLVVVGSEGYDPSDAGPTIEKLDGHGEESRPIVATICQGRKDDGIARARAEICLSDGPLWEATSLSTGCYEFVAIDPHGLKTTVRWVHRRSAARQKAINTHGDGEKGKKFSFSIINPSSRRHPIIASMTRTTIDILESYPSASLPTNGSPPPSPIQESSASGPPVLAADAGERSLVQTDEQLRTLILVTGIWVAFREGWSQNFGYGDMSQELTSRPSSAAPHSVTRRTASMPYQGNNHQRASSVITQGSSVLDPAGGRSLRSGSVVLPVSDSSTSSPLQGTGTDSGLGSSSSMGTAFAQDGRCRSSRTDRRVSRFTGTPLVGDRDEGSEEEPLATQRAQPAPVAGYAAQVQIGSVESNGKGRDQHLRGTGTENGEEHRSKWGKLRNLLVLVRHSSGVH